MLGAAHIFPRDMTDAKACSTETGDFIKRSGLVFFPMRLKSLS